MPPEPPDETPPSLDTPAEIAAERERCEAKGRWHRLMAESFETQVAMLKRREALARGGVLPRVLNATTLDTMNTSPISNARRSRTALDDAHRRHPFVAALVKRGVTVAKAAAAIGRPRSTVQSWYKGAKDPAYREIPWDCAEKIRELYGVPHSAWRSVGPKE